MSDFAHALGRSVGGSMHMQSAQTTSQPGMQQGMNYSQTQQQNNSLQHHQQQQLALRLQQQQQQQQQGPPSQSQPNFQSVSQQAQQRMNVGSVGVGGPQQGGGLMQQQPGLMRPVISNSMQQQPNSQLQNPNSQPRPLTINSQQSASNNPFAPQLQHNGQQPGSNSSLLNMHGGGGGSGFQSDMLQSMMKQSYGAPSSIGLGGGGGVMQQPQHESNNSRFDMTEFPSLTEMNDGGGGGGGKLNNNTNLSGQLALNQHQQQQQQDSSFLIQNEDFPALGGAPTPRRAPTGTTAASILQQRAVGSIGQTTPAGPTAATPVSQTTQPSTTLPSTARQPNLPRPKALTCDKYGLTGLLSVIRMTDPDLNTLALGTDLTTLGLNLNSSEVLYATFASPCLDVPTRSDPDYVLPFAYYMQPPALKTSHLAKFTLETLFYIFYNMPKDTLQVYAAKELYKREWRYHKDLKLWFSRAANATPTTATNTTTGGVTNTTSPTGELKKDAQGKEIKDATNPQTKDGKDATTAGTDANTYLYFDIQSWERRIFRETHILQPNKFMTEEDWIERPATTAQTPQQQQQTTTQQQQQPGATQQQHQPGAPQQQQQPVFRHSIPLDMSRYPQQPDARPA